VQDPHKTAVFARELAEMNRRSPGSFEPCLIAIEACAYPVGEAGARRRAWAGLWDVPIAGWAAVHRDGRVAGVLGPANGLVAQVSAHMPWILQPGDWAGWLTGQDLRELAAPPGEEAWYLETCDEEWSRGRLID
jgi:putative SOS response-associated peptidase YedK